MCIRDSTKTFAMMKNFFPKMDLAGRKLEVKDGESLTLGKHVLTFVFAPMVHWPEVMVTYDSTDKVLFAADGFGKFGALDREEPWDCLLYTSDPVTGLLSIFGSHCG